jgi:hypothetical protein
MGRVAAFVVAGLAVLAAAALGVFFWLRTYAPLRGELPVTPGAGVADSRGTSAHPVFVPAYAKGRPFRVTFTLHNTGRFAITLLGADEPASVAQPRTLLLRPHDTALVTLSWPLSCPRAWSSVRLRYRYLSGFTRTATVALPFAVTVRCPAP